MALAATSANAADRFPKLDSRLADRAGVTNTLKTSRVIVTLHRGSPLPAELKPFVHGDKLESINAQVIDVPDNLLGVVSNLASVVHVHDEAMVYSSNFRTGITSGAFFARTDLGFTGAGVGVAFVDSGVSPHPDLHITASLDFVGTGSQDDAGHGTHIAGSIAGSGAASFGKQSGMAPDAALWSLKALGADGSGRLSDVLAALDWLALNAVKHHIRVVNLSFGTPVTESYETDPLTLATRALVEQGVVVVVAAGNQGQDSAGHKVFGGITSPGNAPWVITVGASSSMGSLSRSDDTVADFSSRGPTSIDYSAKPDLVASGVGIVSAAAFGSMEYQNCLVAIPTCLLGGSRHVAAPYLSLTGTSMAAPVVTGAVALMLQANPGLTPNLVKAILEYTAQIEPGYRPLEEGAGFLNTLGAVRLARFYKTATKGAHVPVEAIWGKQIIWGNHQISGGIMVPAANAWADNIVWGTARAFGDNIVWGTACGVSDCGDNIVWGTAGDDDIVWGTEADDNIVSGTASDDNIVWGTSMAGDNIVWGTARASDNIVWGSDCGGGDCDNIVWGTAAGGDNILWGTAELGDNIVWGTARADDNIVWGTSDGDNIVWGTAARDNIVWGTASDDNIVWGTASDDNIVWGTRLRTRRGDGQAQPLLQNPSYLWFLNFRNDVAWIRVEFGDTFVLGSGGRR